MPNSAVPGCSTPFSYYLALEGIYIEGSCVATIFHNGELVGLSLPNPCSVVLVGSNYTMEMDELYKSDMGFGAFLRASC